MVLQVGVGARVPLLIVDKTSGDGVEGLTLGSLISVNGEPFAPGNTPREIGGGWYHLWLKPEATGWMVVTVNGGEGNSTWRDIVEVWAMEPVIPVLARSIRAGVST